MRCNVAYLLILVYKMSKYLQIFLPADLINPHLKWNINISDLFSTKSLIVRQAHILTDEVYSARVLLEYSTDFYKVFVTISLH